MSALPSKERLEELRAHTASRGTWAYLDARCPLNQVELLALLDAAIALRRLERALMPELDSLHVTTYQPGGGAGRYTANISGSPIADGPTILAAITAALEKAGAK